jgi:Glutamyl-tRNA reductase
VIKALRERGDRVVRAEIDRWASRLTELTAVERDAVEAIARGVAAKLLHDPIVAMKERNEPGTDRGHARLLAELFGLDPDDER